LITDFIKKKLVDILVKPAFVVGVGLLGVALVSGFIAGKTYVAGFLLPFEQWPSYVIAYVVLVIYVAVAEYLKTRQR
jgi:hypothetical protein